MSTVKYKQRKCENLIYIKIELNVNKLNLKKLENVR